MIEKIKEHKKELLSGKIKTIPCSLTGLQKYFIGPTKGHITCITANSNVGKTPFTKELFIYQPIQYAIENKLNLKVLVFSIEETKEDFYWSVYSYVLGKHSKNLHRVNIIDLCSYITPLSEEVIEYCQKNDIDSLVDQYFSYIEFIEEYNPTGIYKAIQKYAFSKGTFYDILGNVLSEEDLFIHRSGFKKYVPNDPDEFVIVCVDNVNVLLQEKGSDLSKSIAKMVEYIRFYVVKHFNYCVAVVHQQALEKESLEHLKFDAFIPTMQGLGDNKLVAREYLTIIGLYDPFQYGVDMYPRKNGYILSELGRYSRFVTIAKQRVGNKHKAIPLFFDGKNGRFFDLPSPDNEDLLKFKKLAKKYEE